MRKDVVIYFFSIGYFFLYIEYGFFRSQRKIFFIYYELNQLQEQEDRVEIKDKRIGF